jgi:response regulator RpfG family c-di-GMP phosphodiesterase
MGSSTNMSALEVVVLDHSKFYLSLTRQMLTYLGVRRIRSYDDPEAALVDLLAEPSDLIVVDSKMPKHFVFLQLIRGLRDASLMPICLTPIIVTSSTPTKSFVEGAMRSGANTVLAKPFSPHALKQRVDRAFADRDKLVVKGHHYIVAEIVDALEARAMTANPSTLAAVLQGGEEAWSKVMALQSILKMMQSPDSSPGSIDDPARVSADDVASRDAIDTAPGSTGDRAPGRGVPA